MKPTIVLQTMNRYISLSELKPLQFAIVCGGHIYDGHLVMRTASTEKFEVINLSLFRKDSCWLNNESTTKVQPVEVEMTIIVKE
jgi:hypothetical protein